MRMVLLYLKKEGPYILEMHAEILMNKLIWWIRFASK